MIPWWRFRERRACQHFQQRCIHGDEINHVGGYRAQCRRCGRFLPELPIVCSVTGGSHGHMGVHR